MQLSPSQLRGRPTQNTYVYDAAGRVERTIVGSAWTAEDRALMLAYRRYRRTLHERCGHPIDKAWNPKNDSAMYDAVVGVCHACTAMEQALGQTEPQKVVVALNDTRDYDAHPLPPISLDDFDT